MDVNARLAKKQAKQLIQVFKYSDSDKQYFSKSKVIRKPSNEDIFVTSKFSEAYFVSPTIN